MMSECMNQMEPGKRENPQVRRTKAWLTEALLDLMKSKPYAKITIQELVERANLSRSAFYNHYCSKDEIIYEKLQTLYLDEIEYLTALKYDSQYHNWLVRLQLQLQNRDFYCLIYENGLSELMYKVVLANYDAMFTLIAQTVGQEVRNKELYANFFNRYHRKAEIEMTLQWLKSGDPAELTNLARMFYSLGSMKAFHSFTELYYDEDNYK